MEECRLAAGFSDSPPGSAVLHERSGAHREQTAHAFPGLSGRGLFPSAHAG